MRYPPPSTSFAAVAIPLALLVFSCLPSFAQIDYATAQRHEQVVVGGGLVDTVDGGLTIDSDGTLHTTSSISTGIDETIQGFLNVYGDDGANGPQIRLHNAADEDTSAEYIVLESDEGTLQLYNEGSTNIDATFLLGQSDSRQGNMFAYGGATIAGGVWRLYNAGDEDTTTDYWGMQPNGTDLYFGTEDDLDAHIFSAAGDYTNVGDITSGDDIFVGDALDVAGIIIAGSGNNTITIATGLIDDQKIDWPSATNGYVWTESGAGVGGWAELPSGGLPTGTVDHAVLKWNSGGSAWIEETDITFADNGDIVTAGDVSAVDGSFSDDLVVTDDFDVGGIFNIGGSDNQGILSGQITITQTLMGVIPQTGTDDDLQDILGATVGDIVFIKTTQGGDTVTLLDAAGGEWSFDLSGNFILDSPKDIIGLIYIGTTWREFTASNNG